ncbi:MAG: Holliday junction branch migration protein RuvA [Opitutae bacterium]|nr:Holliday junction branch migration protein RuvA [Opitutae bacterium]MCD8299089.1 Holliday junction branch migration protein RuvA [Opitutae bacterium]
MIVSLRGKLIEAGIFRAVIECAGIGYEVNIPVSTAEKLPAIGEEVRLFSLQTFREDGQSLYGFYSAEERDFFKLLVEKVSGIGPGIALKIFSRLSLPVLQNAIRNSDVAMLSQCPGIGKKTAERLIVELRDKIGFAATTMPATTPGAANATQNATTNAPSVQADAVAALVSLGCKLDQADKAVRNALQKAGDNVSVSTLITLALGNRGNTPAG